MNIDTDRSGCVSVSEFRDLLDRHAFSMADDQVRECS